MDGLYLGKPHDGYTGPDPTFYPSGELDRWTDRS